MELLRLWRIDVDLVFHHVSLRSDRFPLKLSQTLDPPPPLSHRLLFPSSQWEETVVVSDSDLRYWFLINPHICTGICECTLHPLHHHARSCLLEGCIFSCAAYLQHLHLDPSHHLLCFLKLNRRRISAHCCCKGMLLKITWN